MLSNIISRSTAAFGGTPFRLKKCTALTAAGGAAAGSAAGGVPGALVGGALGVAVVVDDEHEVVNANAEDVSSARAAACVVLKFKAVISSAMGVGGPTKALDKDVDVVDRFNRDIVAGCGGCGGLAACWAAAAAATAAAYTN